MADEHEKESPPRAPTLSGDPERELELKVKKHPGDKSAKVDVGSDESMDASDPPSGTQPVHAHHAAPSTGYDADKEAELAKAKDGAE